MILSATSSTSIENAMAMPPEMLAFIKGNAAKGSHFLRSVLSEAKLLILGTQDELERLTKEGTGSRPQTLWLLVRKSRNKWD